MTTALTASSAPQCLNAVALRRHAALVRTLLEELDRIVPSAGAREDVLAEQLIEELTRLGCRILECTATMIHPPESEEPTVGAERELKGIRAARAAA
jgi:hypothetical protein